MWLYVYSSYILTSGLPLLWVEFVPSFLEIDSPTKTCECFFFWGGMVGLGAEARSNPPQEGKGNGHSRLNAHWHMVIKQGLLPYLTHCNVSLTNEQRMKGTVQLEQKELWWSRACKMGLWLPREKLWCPDTKGYRITISPSRSSILRTVRVAQKLLKKLKESGG